MELVDPLLPSTDREVKQALRLLEAPILIFAETAAERRSRLYKLMVERGYTTFDDICAKLHANPVSLSQLQDGKGRYASVPVTTARTKEGFSQASPLLVEKRTALLSLTMARAERRIASLKKAFLASATAVRAAHLSTLEELRKMRLTKSVRNVKMMNSASNASVSSSSIVGVFCMPLTTCVAVPLLPHTVVTGAADGVITVWDTNLCVPRMSISSCDTGWGRVQHLAAHPSKPLVFSTTMFDYRIALWRVAEDVDGNVSIENNRTGYYINPLVTSTTSNGDEKRCGGVGLERVGVSVAQHTARIQRLAVDPTGLLLASTSDDSTVCLWDVAECAPVGELRHLLKQDGYETAHGTVDVCFHPDGSLLSTTDKAGRVVTWDTRSGMHAFTTAGKYGGHLNACTCVSWSPCGIRFASGAADNLVHIWDARYLSRGAAEAPCILVGHEDVVTSVAFYSNDTFRALPSAIVTTSLDGTVRLWDADTLGVCAHVLPGPFPVRAQCQPAGGAQGALFTVSHSKYWSLWEIVAGGEEFEVLEMETEATSMMKAPLVQEVNINAEEDDNEEEEEEEDEMMLLRKTKAPAVEKAKQDDELSSCSFLESDEDEMQFLRR